MSRSLETRLAKLEGASAPEKTPIPWHRIIADSQAEADAEQAAMIADGRARPGDNFIHRIIIDPSPRREAV